MSTLLAGRDLEAFRDAVRELLGLHFDDTRLEELADALRERVARTGSDGASYLHLLRGPGGRAETRALAELLTVCETFFFRHAEQFRALAEVAIPERLRSRSPRQALRLLSAGCSSGEEAYSIAILVRESFPGLRETDVRITGIDVNPARLERARAGRYRPWSLRETPEPVRGRWLHPCGSEHVLDDAIRSAVTFEERNLLEDDPLFWDEGAFDVVFFRNVGMYFAPGAMQAVTSRIARALAPGGFLFLGHAENLRGISQDFHLRHSHDCFYYQLRPPEAGEVRAAARVEPPAAAPPLIEGACSWVDAIQGATDRIAALEARPGGEAAQGVGRAALARASSPPARPDLAAAVELLREERIPEALALIDAWPAEAGADPDAQLLRAVLLTSCGRLEEAERVCAELLRLDDLNAAAHYLTALCREHAGDRGGAREHDEMAAYVDPGFAMPRLHLGLLAKRAGDRAAACRDFAQADILLQRDDPSRILLFGGGFRRENLVQLCRAELRACGGLP
jgi:chemotaxis protein methyltransferase CheR